MYLLERYVPTNEKFFYNCTDEVGNKYIKITLDQCPVDLDWVVTANGEEGMEMQEWYEDYSVARGVFNDLWGEGVLSIEKVKAVFWSKMMELREKLVAEYGSEAVESGEALGIDLVQFAELYEGKFGCDEEFVGNLIDQTGMMDEWPDVAVDYFDLESYTTDTMFNFYEMDSHYFRSV